MAITTCPECGGDVAKNAAVCHNCGYKLCDAATAENTSKEKAAAEFESLLDAVKNDASANCTLYKKKKTIRLVENIASAVLFCVMALIFFIYVDKLTVQNVYLFNDLKTALSVFHGLTVPLVILALSPTEHIIDFVFTLRLIKIMENEKFDVNDSLTDMMAQTLIIGNEEEREPYVTNFRNAIPLYCYPTQKLHYIFFKLFELIACIVLTVGASGLAWQSETSWILNRVFGIPFVLSYDWLIVACVGLGLLIILLITDAVLNARRKKAFGL